MQNIKQLAFRGDLYLPQRATTGYTQSKRRTKSRKTDSLGQGIERSKDENERDEMRSQNETRNRN